MWRKEVQILREDFFTLITEAPEPKQDEVAAMQQLEY
jgi:hypothetical protein